MTVSPYGSWRSPITPDIVLADVIRLDQVGLDGDALYWTELHPEKQGRCLLYRLTDGAPALVTPEDGDWNVRTKVHQYGGGAFAVHDGSAVFSNFADQRLYRLESGGAPQPITPAGALRYADGVIDPERGRMICVVEDHDGPGQARNTLASVDLSGAAPPRTLAEGHDFYAAPRLSPDRRRLAWLTWDHPDMPWVATELWVAEMEGEALGRPRLVAGGPDEALCQPQFSPDGVLYFVSDRGEGWWNLFRERNGEVEPVQPLAAEFGAPAWNLNMSSYAFESAARLICSYVVDGAWRLAAIDTATCAMTPIATRFTSISQLRAAAGRVVFVGGSASEPPALVELDLGTGTELVIRRSATVAEALRPYISAPEAIAFETSGGETAHAFYYAPVSADITGPPNEMVPVLVKTHGGPTSSASNTLSLAIQYWTSRGIGVLDVNYRGSSGYGRAYRLRLAREWGVIDVDDCAFGARHLVAHHNADPARLAISGGSAGGYTTLRALTAPEKTFAAGASYYGVSDLAALARDTHKFESRYLDWLIGPYPAEQALYAERSPINHIDQLTVPVIFFQGTEDEVVPPNQTQMMVDGLKTRGIPFGCFLFEGEQHGFRKKENIRRAMEAELYFYAALMIRSGLSF